MLNTGVIAENSLMNYRYVRVVLGFSLGLMTLSQGYTQISDTLFHLEEVQIVSDRLGLPETRTGRHVTVINSAEIQSLPVNSIDELLRYVPFLEIQSRGRSGAQSDILMRGSTFNQVLVLIDGMRINDPLTGHFNSNIPVSMTEISRIEVYRGPASTVYGPDAVGGVVNIITKSFEPGIQEDDCIDGRVEAWYGQYNLRRSNSGLNISKGRWKAGAGISYNASDGHRLEPDSLHGDFHLGTASLSLSGELSEKVRVSIRTAFDKRLFNARYFYTNSPLDLSREEVRKWWNQVQLGYRLNESHSITLMAGYQTTRDSFLFNPVFPANIHRTHFYNYQLNHLFIPGNGFRLASGIQADNRKIFSSDRGDRHHWHTGGYVMLSKVFRDDLCIGAGLRLDYDQVYGLEALPQLNLSYYAGMWNFRGSAGRSIRSPDFTERYISTGLEGPLIPGRNLGNPNLLAERAWSIEAGADRKIMKSIQFRLTGFYRFGRDLIDYVWTATEDIQNNGNLLPGESYFYTRNIGLLTTAGIEAELTGKHLFSGRWMLEWGLSYQGLDSRSDSAIVSKYLAAHSRNLINARLGLNSGAFRIQVNSIYKNRDAETAQEINQSLSEDYMLWNIRLDKFFWDMRLQLSLQVNNLLDKEYSDIMGAKMPGRWILGGITWNFYR
ncbi:Vitamin B12 transporter BtuB [subsurface metagenome]